MAHFTQIVAIPTFQLVSVQICLLVNQLVAPSQMVPWRVVHGQEERGLGPLLQQQQGELVRSFFLPHL